MENLKEYTNERLKTTTTIYQNYENNFLTYLNVFIDLISINKNKSFKLIFISNNSRILNTFKSILVKQISSTCST